MTALDLTACDREPIHIPGSIQPHGLLLIADPETLEVIGGAGDIEGRLDAHWLGRTLDDLLGQDVSGKLAAKPEHASVVLDRIVRGSALLDLVARRVSGHVAVELEPAIATPISAAEALLALNRAGTLFERSVDLQELCDRAAAAFRGLTGFDRVLIYRFLDDEAGVVVAESLDPALGSFLNHHFPASDIPQQARDLYVRNRVRVIPDVEYTAAPLRSASSDLTTFDMSDLSLRSVSPIHLQYLINMGVAASASVSIVRDGILWGLIACHNATRRELGHDVRLACEALAGTLARQIRAKQEAEHYRERIRLRSLEDAVATRLGAEASLEEFFATMGDELCGMLAARGFAAIQGSELYTAGHCPEADDVRDLSRWVRGRISLEPFSTHRLCEAYPAALNYCDRASGLLATTMATEQPTVLMWFRPEELEVVNWAGNPHKAVDARPDELLTPRASFAAWSETVSCRSRPWSVLELESATRLMHTFYEARQNRRVRDLNRELIATIADNESLLVQKDYLLREVNHRTQNSLQLVSGFLGMQASAVADEQLTAHLQEAQRRVSAVALVHRRLYSDTRLESVDLSRYLSDLCDELKSSMDPAWGPLITARLSPVIISADRAIPVGLILTELIINANKYAYAGAAGAISINLEQHGERFRLIVADKGAGRTGTRQGFGTRMLGALIKQLSGTFDEGDNAPGLRVVVTAPIL